MKITNDPIMGRAAKLGQYEALFQQLSPKANCIVSDDYKEIDRVAQALEGWAKKHVPGAKVRTTKAYPVDGKPRCWLVYPEQPNTKIRGNWPTKAA